MVMFLESEKYKTTQNPGEHGNVLFLILIAVALFAALSYAVTHSSQVGSGTADDETGQVSAAQLNQFPTIIRSRILRMRTNHVQIEELEFNPPSEFTNLSSTQVGVFHPQFGTNYSTAAPNLMADEQQGQWYFNMNFEVNHLSTSSTGSLAGNDLIAFLPGVKINVCQRINDLSGIFTIPTVNNGAYFTQSTEYMDNNYSLPSTELVIGDTNLAELTAQPFGCFLEQASMQHIYYSTLVER